MFFSKTHQGSKAKNTKAFLLGSIFVLVFCAEAAAIPDILVSRNSLAADAKLVTGERTSGASTGSGAQVFTEPLQTMTSGLFQGKFFSDDPGFAAEAAPPGGVFSLPANSPLSFSLVPVKNTLGDGAISNLLYWDGTGGVEFGPPPSGASLTLYDFALSDSATTSATPDVIPGFTISTTGNTGVLHEHLPLVIDDGDGNPNTFPADGVYLSVMVFQMEGLKNSDPVYLAHSNLGSAIAPAESWLLDHFSDLPLAVPGDLNGDLIVDSDDLGPFVLALTDQEAYALEYPDVEETIAGDVNLDGIFNLGDVGAFKQLLASGQQESFAASQSVPEPGALTMVSLLMLLGINCGVRSRSV